MKPRKSKNVLAVSDLHIRRGGTPILAGISWTIEPGQHWVMLGANGSGKTSLLSALTGYLMPTAGTITLWQQQYGRCDWRALRRQIGLVSSSVRQMMADTEPALESVVSGKSAMIDFWGRVTRADRARAMRILRSIECAHLADRPWAYLSQGERQRILIGRALMARPKLLILDEPCAGLDPAAREHFLQFIERLGRQPKAPTLVLVTHHVEEITPVFTHVLMLHAGAVLAQGPTTKMLTSSLLGRAFGSPVRLGKTGARYQLSVRPTKKGVL